VGGWGEAVKCQGNLPLGKKDKLLMFVLYFQNTIIKMIQYKQKKKKEKKKACNETTHASTKLHNPCQVKKDYLTYIRKTLL